jgi:predicted nucleotidyltransferase component of viral defense system
MILKREIESIAEEKKVPKSIIDKDWVLGHFIDAIYSLPEYRDKLVFKGGTCLHKCYFNDYRFSEDLDFTSNDPEFVLDRKLLENIVGILNERTEIPAHIQNIERLNFRDKLTGFSATIRYWGAEHPRNQAPPTPQRWQTSVKIEVILYEKMIFPPEIRKVNHEYSDQLSVVATTIPCYSINEILAEKLRSLIQRSYTAPRDYYDVWYLSNSDIKLDWSSIVKAFHQKMEFKGLKFTGVDEMINNQKDKRLLGAWKNSLDLQVIGELPEYLAVKRDLLNLFNRIF